MINTTSVTAYKGSPTLLDYSSTKGAIVAFTRSLALSGPARHPGQWRSAGAGLEPADSFHISPGEGGILRLGYPSKAGWTARRSGPELCVFLASVDSSYMTGQTLHPNRGTGVNG